MQCPMVDREPYPSEKQERFIVRFPDGMRDRIKRAAAENNRSMNAEIVSALEICFPEAGPTIGEIDGAFGRHQERMHRQLWEAVNTLRAILNSPNLDGILQAHGEVDALLEDQDGDT